MRRILMIAMVVCCGINSLKDDLVQRCHPSYYTRPICLDHPDGYGCNCGPGFVWNTHTCVAIGLNSRLEYNQIRPVRYTRLLNKAFPELESFTVTLWLKVQKARHPGTILSYSHGSKANLLQITSGPTLRMRIHEADIRTNVTLNRNEWIHLSWGWTSIDGSWKLDVNGGYITIRGRSDLPPQQILPIPAGGELVLGQSSDFPNFDDFLLDQAFLGGMAFVNIWRRVLSQSEINRTYKDCGMKECGDAVEWADFRTGTRGAMKIRWPAEIFEIANKKSKFRNKFLNYLFNDRKPLYVDVPCVSELKSGHTCDQFCSRVIGVQCNAEVLNNILWARTPAGRNATVPCPDLNNGIINMTVTSAYRECLLTDDNRGVWKDPKIEDCILDEDHAIKRSILDLFTRSLFNESRILQLASVVLNHTAMHLYTSPIVIRNMIDSLGLLIKAQGLAVGSISTESRPSPWGQDREVDQLIYPSFQQTQDFAHLVLGAVDNLMVNKNEAGWMLAQPPGAEADKLLQVLADLMELLATSLQFHVRRADVAPGEARLVIFKNICAIKVGLYRTKDLRRLTFPDHAELLEFGHADNKGSITLSSNPLLDTNRSTTPEYIAISVGRYAMGKVLPNHDIISQSKDDNINSALFSIQIHLSNISEDNISFPIQLNLPYLNDFNISNPECVYLQHGNRRKAWKWNQNGCTVARNYTSRSICHCHHLGYYAVTTDMYNIHWKKVEVTMLLMAIPSYVGCSISALLCLISFVLLLYLRTESKTAAIHKNFAVSIICSQLSFMFGIDKFHHETVCHVFAISLHYFFLTTFSWLMNETFNLYIVITYAAHSHGEHSEGGSQLRYYVLGWLLPGILVGAFLGTHVDDYYAPDMCWINWQYVWLFLGPVVGIISVIILVLVFTAKEHYESSYAKNEKTNKMLVNHSKALWTQVILLSLSWTFAFLSIKMTGIILKVLFALFNSMQGAFFLVFYFLLNEEVRTVYQVKLKKGKVGKLDLYEYSPSASLEDFAEDMHEMIEIETSAEESTSTGRVRRSSGKNWKTRHKREMTSSSEDDGSDIEMVTSV